MSDVLNELLALLDSRRFEENIFRGRSQDLGFGALFGGQVLGQALSAASRTVSEDRFAHSLHGYFLRPGDATRGIVYQVERTRDGRSFATRRVQAIQHGVVICSVSASFHLVEPGHDHQDDPPIDVPGPHELISEQEMARRFKDRIPEAIRAKILCDKPIEIRPVNPVNPFAPDARPARKFLWMRAAGALPDDMAVHQYLLAYASDFGLVGTSLYPHGKTYWDPAMRVASIDHAMWFHRPFRLDSWLLHAMDSPSASNARGLSRGSIFSEDGTLVASVVQEGLIRDRQLSEPT